MIHLKSTDHFFKIGKDLLEDEEFCDIVFITDKATFYGHSQLLFQHVHLLSSLVCDQCKYSHEKSVIFLPDVESEFLEIALMEFYLKGDSRKLNWIFNANGAENNLLGQKNSRSIEEISNPNSNSCVDVESYSVENEN